MLPTIPQLLHQADQCLQVNRAPAKRLIQVYALVWAVAVIVINLLSYFLDEASAGLSGLSHAGTRNNLLVVNVGITLVLELALLLWQAGYSGAALSLSRGNAPKWQQLLWGLYQPHRYLLCGLVLFVRWFVLTYLVTMLFVFVMPPELLLDGDMITDVAYNGLMMLTGLVLAILVFNRRLLFFRMADGVDRPVYSVYREAIGLLRRRRGWFLRIDLHFWWYYLARVAIVVLPYGSLLLPETHADWMLALDLGLLLISTASTVCLELTCRNRIWVTYALAYDALLQEWEESAKKTLPAGEE